MSVLDEFSICLKDIAKRRQLRSIIATPRAVEVSERVRITIRRHVDRIAVIFHNATEGVERSREAHKPTVRVRTSEIKGHSHSCDNA